jgi:hypothetical protein
MTVGRLLEEIGSGELAEWAAMYDLEPWGCDVDDLRAGMGPALTINMNRASGDAAIRPLELFPWQARREAQDEVTPEQLAATIKERLLGGDG